jgi:hypothetical protein
MQCNSSEQWTLAVIVHSFRFHFLPVGTGVKLQRVFGEFNFFLLERKISFCFLLITYESLWRWYINANIMFLDIIHHPILIKTKVSETGFCLRLQVETTHFGPINKAGSNWVGSAWRRRLNSVSEMTCVLHENQNRSMDNVQKNNICITFSCSVHLHVSYFRETCVLCSLLTVYPYCKHCHRA